ncbi:MAG: hypothetical protein P8Y71_29760 [Pseudolabrys sp.]
MIAGPDAAQNAGKDVAAKAQVCAACHGDKGVPVDKTIPVIWGQQVGYFYLQLRDFKRGVRKNPLMAPIVETLSRDDMMALAEYFSKKKWPQLGQPRAPADVAKEAERTNGSIGCTGCHQGNFQGAGTQPRLAGQRRAADAGLPRRLARQQSRHDRPHEGGQQETDRGDGAVSGGAVISRLECAAVDSGFTPFARVPE